LIINKYPYSKELMLSAIYDALDSLGMPILSANRERGTVVIIPPQSSSRIRIAVNEGGGIAEVAVIPEGGDTIELCGVIADEISSVIKKS